MADIISIDQKRARLESEKAAQDRKRKILSVKNVMQCSQCAFKCEKCGMHIDPDDRSHLARDHTILPYRFCENCREEYIEFIQRLKGGGNPEYYWHNHDWIELWRRWIDYQSALDKYIKSQEFLQLLHELQQSEPDEEE